VVDIRQFAFGPQSLEVCRRGLVIHLSPVGGDRVLEPVLGLGLIQREPLCRWHPVRLRVDVAEPEREGIAHPVGHLLRIDLQRDQVRCCPAVLFPGDIEVLELEDQSSHASSRVPLFRCLGYVAHRYPPGCLGQSLTRDYGLS
jgi:hypothetical protein